jgi:hypothetical protein
VHVVASVYAYAKTHLPVYTHIYIQIYTYIYTDINIYIGMGVKWYIQGGYCACSSISIWVCKDLAGYVNIHTQNMCMYESLSVYE